jgi:sec-independent protein translocase protein TatB
VAVIMNGMSFSETIFLFLLALLVFGPKKLPEIGRQIGKLLNEFRRASNEFRSQIEAEISQAEMKDRQILPPAEAPSGVVATLPFSPEPKDVEALPPATIVTTSEAAPGSFSETTSDVASSDTEVIHLNVAGQPSHETAHDEMTDKASHV